MKTFDVLYNEIYSKGITNKEYETKHANGWTCEEVRGGGKYPQGEPVRHLQEIYDKARMIRTGFMTRQSRNSKDYYIFWK